MNKGYFKGIMGNIAVWDAAYEEGRLIGEAIGKELGDYGYQVVKNLINDSELSDTKIAMVVGAREELIHFIRESEMKKHLINPRKAALSLMKYDILPEYISKYTGLSIEEIEELSKVQTEC